MPAILTIRAAADAIQRGDVESLRDILRERPEFARERVDGARTLLHIVTDWPGHLSRGAESVRELVAAGADVNARSIGRHAETPLHWAASCDDVEVLDALLDAGANIEADGAVIGGGTPLSDACAFAQWKAARRLLERGATTSLWEAASLGLLDRVRGHFTGSPLRAWQASGPRPEVDQPDEVTHAFWCACHGGHLATAQDLHARGANINWLGYDNRTPLGAARKAGVEGLVDWLLANGAK